MNTKKLKHIIEFFNNLADAAAEDAKTPGSDFRIGMDHGLSIGYRSAANHLQSEVEEAEKLENYYKYEKGE